MRDGSRREELVSRVRREVPRRAGIYRFLDRHGQVIYVGKSVNLRQRVASYFSRGAAKAEIRMKRMIAEIRDFSFTEALSELHALLMEDAAIKELLPFYNVRQKEFFHNRFLHLTDGAFPSLASSDEASPGTDHAFGPFKDRYFVERLLEAIRAAFGLRSCRDAEPRRQCLNAETGFCAGPCRGSITEREYAGLVDRVETFLAGDDSAAVRTLTAEMKKYAAAFDFERAARIRDRIAFCRLFCARQRFVARFASDTFVIHENGSTALTHIFVNGAHSIRKGRLSKRRMSAAIQAARRRGPRTGEDPRLVADRAQLVHRWLKAEGRRSENFFVAPVG